ncbi:MAG: glycine cleavage system protein GcvH [Herpetosiphon sp.]
MAYKTPTQLLYGKSHEWITPDGDERTVGISDYAQHALGDVVFVELPEVGQKLTKGQNFGVVESVKAASDVFAPVSGTVTAVNEALLDAPETLNTAMYDAGWLIKIRPDQWAQDRADLFDAAAYEKHVEDEASKH